MAQNLIDFTQFGAALKLVRKERLLTQKQAAQETGVNHQSLSHIEQHGTQTSAENFMRLCVWAKLNPIDFCRKPFSGGPA